MADDVALGCGDGALDPDSDVVESLLRTLEEMTDTAVGTGENDGHRATPSVGRLLQTPLENFYNSMALKPKQCEDVPYLPGTESPQELMTNLTVCDDVESIFSDTFFREDVKRMNDIMTRIPFGDVNRLPHSVTNIPICDDALGTQPETTDDASIDDRHSNHTSVHHEENISTTHEDGNDVTASYQQVSCYELSACQSAVGVQFLSTQSAGSEDLANNTLPTCLSVDPTNTSSGNAKAVYESIMTQTTSRESQNEDNSNDTGTCARCFGDRKTNSISHIKERLTPECLQTFSDAVSSGSDSNTSTESSKRFETCFSSWESLLKTIDIEEHLFGEPDSVGTAGAKCFNDSPKHVDVTSSLSDPSSESSLDSSGTPSSSSEPSIQGRARKKRNTFTSSIRQLPPCRVCAQPAAGLHYGVNTCEACKGFFRRSLLRHLPYKCKGNRTCDVNGKQKRVCPACRHKRCLAVGMSPDAIKTGRYTHKKRDQDLREIQRLQTASGLDGPPLTDVDVDAVVAGLLEANKHVPTNAHLPPDVIESKSREAYENSQLGKDAFGLRALSAEEYEEIYRTTVLDVDGRRSLIKHMANCMEHFIVGHVRFAKGIPGFQALPVNDQASLLKVALSELWFLAGYKGFRKKYGTFFSLSGVVHTYSQSVHMSGKEGNDYMLNLAENFQKWDITKEELVVLKAICLTFTDRCELQEARKVEEIQTMMLKCFYMLLSRRHENTNMALAQALSRLVALRDMTEMERRHNARSLVKDVYKEHPVLMEVILY